jgi:hypothetical protein
VATNLGYCGLDRRLGALTGDELRPCWEAQPETPDAPMRQAGQDAIRPTLPMASPLWLDGEA